MLLDQTKPISIISFGEILWDVIEDRCHLGGAAYNLSAHAARLGLQSRLLSGICADELGCRALIEARQAGVDVSDVQIQSTYPTGVVNVALSDGQPDYVIQSPAAWDFIECPSHILSGRDARRVDAICFGTLAQRNVVSRETLKSLVEHFRAIPKFYDVNLRQDYYSAELIEWGFRNATVVKVNNHESDVISELLFGSRLTNDCFAQEVCRKYGVEVVLVTLGPQGCLVATPSDIVRVPGKPVSVLDTVGAGDAFSAGFLSAWLRGSTYAEAAGVGNHLGAYTATMRGAAPEYSSQLVTQIFALEAAC